MTRIMYIERKEESLNGKAVIGRVKFSKTGRTLFYKNLSFLKVGNGYKYNFIEEGSGDKYWISGCKKNGEDRLYSQGLPVYIDEDVREEYWTTIRNQPYLKSQSKY